MPQTGSLPALDVAIGLILVFLVLAQIVSLVNELIARVFKWRAKFLEEGIRNLLNDPEEKGLAAAVFNHPLVRGLQRHGATADPKNAKRPSYLPASVFAAALFDTLAPPAADAPGASRDLLAAARDSVSTIEDEQVRRSLLALTASARGDLDRFRTAVEQWYDAAMDRVSGWYTRRAHKVVLVLSLALALAVNADAIQISSTLWKDDTTRAAVVAEANKVAAGPGQPTGSAEERLKTAAGEVDHLAQLQLPIGWKDSAGDPRTIPHTTLGWVWKLLGIVFTGLAVSLGAPFWFDLLGKAARLRSAGAKPAPAADPPK
jgi:hypothetical protein